MQVDLVLLPAVTGDFGVMPGHVPTVAQLRPGVVTVHKELDKQIEKFFVSSGFAFVHADSATDVVAVEAVNLEDLDTEAVRAGLQVCFAARPGCIQTRQRRIERPVPLTKKEGHTIGRVESQCNCRNTLQSWRQCKRRATTMKLLPPRSAWRCTLQ